MMVFEVRDTISSPGNTSNEDIYGLTPTAAWVLDGATGLGGERLLPGPSDACWLVTRFSQALSESLAVGGATDGVLAKAMKRLRSDFARDAEAPDPHAENGPSASFVMARLLGETLELNNLGDCKILHRRATGDIQMFGSSGLEVLDGEVRKAVIALAPQKLDPEAMWRSVLPLVRANRALRNTPDGYWTLDVSGVGVPHLQRKAVLAEAGDEILLMSDGFFRLVDIYGRYTVRSLFEAVRLHGVALLDAELRDIEQQDADLRTYPRLKARDDATAVWVAVTERLA